MGEKSCCVTGHRDIPTDKLPYVEEELRKAVQAAIEDGFTRFISGFAEGRDYEKKKIMRSEFQEVLVQNNKPRNHFA